MKKYNIPTAQYNVVKNVEEGLAVIEKSKFPLVIKADGLALGKGVVICESKPTRGGSSYAKLPTEHNTPLPYGGVGGGSSSRGALSYEEQKAQARAQKKREKELADAEAAVLQLESAIAILEEQMATEAGSQDMSLYEKHTKLKQQLTQAEERWMELMETER